MMNRKRGPEHIPLESLTLRGEHVIVRMRVVYRGKKLVHYRGCFITVKLFEKKKRESEQDRHRILVKKRVQNLLLLSL